MSTSSMDEPTGSGAASLRAWLWIGAAFALALALLVVRLSSFGIWDPWELSVADTARRVLSGRLEAREAPPMGPWLISRGFDWLAVREWAGRLPIALCGLSAVACLWIWVRRMAEDRTAVYAALVACTSLALILNSRQMLGDAPGFLAGALVALGATQTLFGASSLRARWAWAGVALAGVVLGVLASGALLATLPPLLAAVAAAGLTGALSSPQPSKQRLPGGLLVALAGGISAWTGYDVWADTAAYSPWVGGIPLGENPPTYDRTLEVVFHGFAPWSALLPLAIGNCLRLDEGEGELRKDAALRVTALLWAAFAYASHSLFQSRFGTAAYPGTLALAAMVALWLRDVELSQRSSWTAGLVAAFFVGLILRDFALYPASPIDAIGLPNAEIPGVFNPKRTWGALLGGFAVAVLIATAARPATGNPLNLRAPYQWLRAQWRGSWSLRAWLFLTGLSLLGLLAFGALAWSLSDKLPLTSLVLRAGRAAGLLPLALPIAIALAQVVWHLVCRWERFRLWPTWAMAAAVALYTAHGFLPSLSGHFSPRKVFDAYNRHAQADEPLAEYKVGSRAAAYYAAGDIQEIRSTRELVTYLGAKRRRWATFPAEKLAEIDRDYRRAHGGHLFLASQPNARVVLAANQAAPGLQDQNPLTPFVRDEAPTPDHPVHVDFQGKIELLGYNLKLPGGEYVGPGQRFEIEWIFRAQASHIGTYKVFVHGDGAGNRLNGDHDPVDDAYPVRLWSEGDVIVDRQTLSVPANFRPGRYTLFMGFFRGSTRLKVSEGPHDNADRARVGHITIR